MSDVSDPEYFEPRYEMPEDLRRLNKWLPGPNITPTNLPGPNMSDRFRSFGVQRMAYAEFSYRVMDELQRAHTKFPNQEGLSWGGNRMYRLEADKYRDICNARLASGEVSWMDIVREEYHEAIAEETPERAIEELVQLAAMAFRAAVDLKRQVEARVAASCTGEAGCPVHAPDGGNHPINPPPGAPGKL